MRRRRGDIGHLLAAAAVIAGGIGIGVLEALRFPRGSIWIVVVVTVALAVIARAVSSRH